MASAEEQKTLEFTPTWVVASVCVVIVGISLAVERFLHYTGKYLKKKNQKPLYEALQKVKEELMLLGFISLLLTVFQSSITKICVKESVTLHLLPCKFESSKEEEEEAAPHHRRLLSAGPLDSGYCAAKNRVPLLSVEALHHLHIFIFVLAITHVIFSVLTVVFGGVQIRKWKRWEDSIAKNNYDTEHVLKPKITHVQNHDFIKNRFLGLGCNSVILGWLQSFVKQFDGSVSKSDYVTLRLGFIMTHCKGNPKFNFHKYMFRALEDDFKEVVGISWYLWIFVVIFLLLNINGWHTYFWIAFIPFIIQNLISRLNSWRAIGVRISDFILPLYDGFSSMAKDRNLESVDFEVYKDRNFQFVDVEVYNDRNLQSVDVEVYEDRNLVTESKCIPLFFVSLLLAVGTKLEHIIIQLAQEVAEKHVAIEGDLVVKPSDNHFWFHRPRIILFLIHFILFQNAFEIGFFFWIWVQYGFNSCIMGQVRFIIPRLVIGVIIQVLCSYSTLPLYAIVTQMGSSFKKSIFEEHVQVGIISWADKVKRKKQLKEEAAKGKPADVPQPGIQLGEVAPATQSIHRATES